MKAKNKFWLEPSPDCRNCGTHMPEGANYCPTCSQRNTTGKINIGAFLKEAFVSLFNIDTKFFRTLFSFAFPGKLTNEFFKGKHQSFASPLRMFFVSAVFFFAIVGWSFQEHVMESDFLEIEDSKRKVQYLNNFKEIKKELELSARNDDVRDGIDSMYQKIQYKFRVDTLGSNFNGVLFGDSIKLSKTDILNLTPDEIIEKNQINGILNQMGLKQFLKFNREPQAFIASFLGKMTLMLLILIPLMAFVFKLLYIRRGRYYVEHLVFLFHFHAFALFVGIMLIAAKNHISVLGIILSCFLIIVYLVASMKNVYQQSWFKTIMKFFIIGFSYIFVFTFCLLFISIVSFLLF